MVDPFLKWREYGGISLGSDNESKQHFWRAEHVGNSDNEFLIQSGYKARNGMRHCLTEWVIGGTITTTPCKYKRGTTFIFESAMEEDMFHDWSEWGSCKPYTCHQKRTRTCKTELCFGSSDDNQICSMEDTWHYSHGYTKTL